MEFLEKVTQHSDANKMDLTNVSMEMAPILFVALPAQKGVDEVTMAAKTSHVVRLLINYHLLLWTVCLCGRYISPRPLDLSFQCYMLKCERAWYVTARDYLIRVAICGFEVLL